MAYRVADIGALAEREFGVRDSLSGMRKLLHGLGLSWLQPRPRHPASDAEAQAEFKKKPPRMVAEVAAAHPEATSIELWFQDETRIGQKGALTRLWGRRGQRLQAKRDLGFGYAYLFGAVCPARGNGAAIMVTHSHGNRRGQDRALVIRQGERRRRSPVCRRLW